MGSVHFCLQPSRSREVSVQSEESQQAQLSAHRPSEDPYKLHSKLLVTWLSSSRHRWYTDSNESRARPIECHYRRQSYEVRRQTDWVVSVYERWNRSEFTGDEQMPLSKACRLLSKKVRTWLLFSRRAQLSLAGVWCSCCHCICVHIKWWIRSCLAQGLKVYSHRNSLINHLLDTARQSVGSDLVFWGFIAIGGELVIWLIGHSIDPL